MGSQTVANTAQSVLMIEYQPFAVIRPSTPFDSP